MTDTRTEKPDAWTEDLSETLFFAARGLAEHDLVEQGVIQSVIDTRLGIAAGVTSALHVLREAGWIRDEPTVDVADTPVAAWGKQARRVLTEWDANPVELPVLPPALSALLSRLEAEQAAVAEQQGQ